jgi:hypothetical protein
MAASINPDDVDVNTKSKEKDEISYLKSMDSLMDELSKKYTDLSKKRALMRRSLITDLAYRMSPKNVAMADSA